MCRRVRCEDCNKPTFSGCGRHVEEVLGSVAQAERCACRSHKAQAVNNNAQQAQHYAVSA